MSHCLKKNKTPKLKGNWMKSSDLSFGGQVEKFLAGAQDVSLCLAKPLLNSVGNRETRQQITIISLDCRYEFR